MSPNWNLEKAQHLLFRAGFGSRPQEIKEFAQLGLAGAIEALLHGPTRTLPTPVWLEEDMAVDLHKLKTLGKEERQQQRMTQRMHVRDLVASWVQFMIMTPTPADMLHERMVFFWHSHFATSVQKVQAAPFIYSQLKRFHDLALGNFSDLLHAIIRDPAMLRYLDNDQNRKGKPNENLARELMELFSLGIGNYTEQDIHEGARALTGWSIERWNFQFRERQHDNTPKTIFGKTGNWNGNDFVDLILEKPSCAEFLALKLWTYFANENPRETTIHDLAVAFRDAKYDIKSLLREIFSHPDFYASEVMGTQIKSPIQLVVGTGRILGLTLSNREFYERMLLMMGQVPYSPPNVKGWPGGHAWIDTSRLMTRYAFAEIIGEGTIPSEIDPRMKGDRELKHSEQRNEAMEMVRNQKRNLGKGQHKSMFPSHLKVNLDATELIDSATSPQEIVERLVQILLPVPASHAETQLLAKTFEQHLAKASRGESLQKLIGKIMQLPAYQLC